MGREQPRSALGPRPSAHGPGPTVRRTSVRRGIMFQLKPISREGVPAALQKAERYRFLNDSSAAESICLDVLEVAPDDQQALVMLLLAITDQLDQGIADGSARAQ